MLVVLTYPVKEPSSLENCSERNYESGADILRKRKKMQQREDSIV